MIRMGIFYQIFIATAFQEAGNLQIHPLHPTPAAADHAPRARRGVAVRLVRFRTGKDGEGSKSRPKVTRTDEDGQSRRTV